MPNSPLLYTIYALSPVFCKDQGSPEKYLFSHYGNLSIRLFFSYPREKKKPDTQANILARVCAVGTSKGLVGNKV